jgi:hypothetical protein
MAFTPVGMSVAFMLVTLGSSSRDEPTFPLETLPDIVVSVQLYVRSGCVYFLRPDIVGKFQYVNSFFIFLLSHYIDAQQDATPKGKNSW